MARFHVETSQIIHASPERVWAAYTDMESHPKWDKTMVTLRVVKREGNVDWVEVEQRPFFGRRETIRGSHTYFPISKVEAQMKSKGFAFRASLTLEATAEGTMFRVVGDVEAPGPLMTLLAPLVRRRMRSASREWNRSLAGYVESLS